MRNFYAFLLLLLIGNFGFGQTTITVDFETINAGYSASATEGSGFTDVFNRSNPNIGGNSSFIWAVEDLNLSNPSIDIDQIDVTGATEFTFSLDMLAHHFQDWDSTDELLITYSTDNGVNYQNLIWVQMVPDDASNGPAAIDLGFDGNGDCGVSTTLPSITSGTIHGCTVSSSNFANFSTSAITLSGVTTLDIKLQFNNLTSTDEGIYLDNIVIDHDGGGTSNSSDADIVESGFDEPDNIDYTSFLTASGLDTGNAIQIGEFTIRDSGATPGDTDIETTTLTDLAFTITGFEDIAAIALFSGPANISEITSVTATTTFSSITGLTAADDGSLTFQVYATFKSSVTDNNQIQLTITSATADVIGSVFSSSDAGGAQTSIIGDDNKIEVNASALVFSQQPPTEVAVNSAMPNVIVEAQDSNGNVDGDFTLNIDITSTGTLSVSPVTENAVAGIATFSTITHTAAGTGLELTASDGSLMVTSDMFDVAVLPVNIGIQDFEIVPQTPVLNFSNTSGGFATGTGPFPNDDNFVSGSRGWEASNETSTLTFGPVDASAYDDLRLDFRLASFSGTSGNGHEGGDEVLVEVSLDNGATFSNEIAINGNNNARWSFDTGEGVATIVYDGDNNETSFTPSSGGNRTTDGYTFISITDLPNSNELVIRVTMSNNSNDEYWIIDDVELSGILLPSYDNDTEIYAASPQIGNSTIVAANTTTIGNDAEVFGFVIEDQGSGDLLPTNVTKMRFVPGANNSALWSTSVEGITLYDENLIDYTPTVSISDSEIILDFGTPIAIADGGSLEFVLGFYIKTTGIVDNSIVQFQVDDTSHGFEADALTGSSFIDPLTLGTFTGPETTIDIDVTQLVISQQPPAIVGLNVVMPDVIVEAQDANGNIDTDYNLNVDITSTGTLSISPVTETAVAGVTTFSTITHTTSGTGLVLTVDDGLFPTLNSTPFDVVLLPTIIAQQDFEGSLPDWSYTTSIPFFGSTSAFGSDFFGIIDINDASPLSYSNFSNNILGENDLENSNGGTFEFVTTTFSEIDINLYESVNLIFDWEVIGYNGPTDDAGYEVFFDGISQGFQFLVDGDIDPQDGSGTVSINVPNAISTVSLNVVIRNNGADGYSGFDNFKLEGFLPSIVYEGNDSNGFGGPLGEGDLEITAFTGTTADFTFIRGGGAFGNNEDYMVIYVDSKTGGFTTTTSFTDTGDFGRKAVSGFNGGNRSTLNFPPGFEADYAIYLDENFAGVFELVGGSGHNFITSANLNPTGNQNATSYDFSVDFADLMTSAGAESFKFVATYLSGDSVFRSNEFIGDSSYDNNALGNPGYTTVDMNTYYQVSSRRKGGRASSAFTGVWSDDASWINGNAPLEGDVITIDHDIVQDINYNSVNNLGANSIEITGANTLTVNSGNTLLMADGITGTGSLVVNGKLSITEGGFTDIVPTYTFGATLEYKDIIATYNRFNEWNPGATVGAGVPDNVIVDNVDLDISNPTGSVVDEDFAIGNDLTVLNAGNLNIDANKSLTVGGDLTNTGSSININSTSQNYASLLVTGTATGDVIYKRHINTFNSTTGSTTGQNDLISAPVTNASQDFGTFRAANANIPSGLVGGVPSFLFGPFDNNNATSPYTLYTTSDDAEVLTAGKGYRTASTDTSTFTFVGDVQTGTVPVDIAIGSAYEWNLIGNPYPSYINSGAFLTENIAFLDEDAVGIYGYDGTADDDWKIINFNTMNEAENLAPGQGFMVAAEGASTLNFTHTMRRVSGGDDFIVGRTSDTNAHLSLKIESDESNYHTDFYFNENSTRALDPGYDAALFNGYLPEFYMYSHLVENNEGRNMAIQSLGENDLTDVTIPLGVIANQGEAITFSINTSTLPSTVEVYLEDNVTNTFTLLTSSDYTLTPNVNLNGTGRFYLRVTNGALSTPQNALDNLSIYTNQSDKTVVIAGQLFETTTANIYDLQGRVVSTSALENANRSHTIDVSNLSTGAYVVQLTNTTQKKTQKVIIK